MTPSLDRMAGKGVVFENAFTANVVCMPSRASLLTGRFPRSHGVVTNGVFLDEENEVTLPEVLAANGYRTAGVGKLHLAPHRDRDPRYAGAEAGPESPESPGFWKAKKTFPLPYHGLQEVRICSAEGRCWMDYYNDLLARDPALPQLINRANAIEPPSGAPSSWKSAIPEEHHSSRWVGDEAIEFLQKYAGETDPFFLFVGFPDPHFPYSPPAPWCNMFDPRSVPMPRRSRGEIMTGSTPYRQGLRRFAEAMLPYHPMDMPDEHIREIIAHTYGMVSLLDKNVGRIVGALGRLDLAENTVVIFTTDHGEHLGDHWLIYKCLPYDELTHLPMIWQCPSRFNSGSRSDGIVSHVDLMPTVLDLAGIGNPRGVQGVSYRQALEGSDFEGRPYAYLEDDEIGPKGPAYLRTLWTPKYRMSYHLPESEGELFHLGDDPNEFVNRWCDPRYREARAHMTELMLRASMEACDPKPERVTPC